MQGRKISEATRERQKRTKLLTQKKPAIKDMKNDFLEEHREWLKQKAQSMGATKKKLDASRGSNGVSFCSQLYQKKSGGLGLGITL